MQESLALEICQLYGLGTPINKATRVTGGLIHTMWRLETNTGSYAVKQLNAQIMSKPNILASFELSESLAQEFAQLGVPAVTSLLVEGHHINKIENIFVIVYPWVEGKILSNAPVTESQAYAVGKVIGNIHSSNMLLGVDAHISGLSIFSNSYWEDLVQRFSAEFPSITIPLEQIMSRNVDADRINTSLKKHIIISHSDIDQKNVLWVADGKPLIIDWESVGPTNPELEIVEAALNWGGLVSGEIKESSIHAVISGYRHIMPNFKYAREYLNGVYIKWLTWLEFNIKRSQSADYEIQTLGLEQVKNTVNILNLISIQFDHLQIALSM